MFLQSYLQIVWPDGRLSWNEYRGRDGDPAVETSGAAYPHGRGTLRLAPGLNHALMPCFASCQSARCC